MRKILIMITLLLSLFCLIGCNQYKRYTTYTKLNYSEFQEKLDNKDSFAVVMGLSTCSACAMYKVTMENVIKENQVEIFYLELDSLSEEEHSKIYSKFVVEMTPTTIFIKEGKETSTYDRIVGAASSTEVVKNLKKHGIIGE